MAKRKAPGSARLLDALSMPEEDKHEKKLRQMHDALYSLGDRIRKPFNRDGEKLLPKGLRSSETPESKQAREHIDRLHTVMSEEK
jgi:hypothetical protein